MAFSRCLPAVLLVGLFVACSSDENTPKGVAGGSGNTAGASHSTAGNGSAGAPTVTGGSGGSALGSAGSPAAGSNAGGAPGSSGSPGSAGSAPTAGAPAAAGASGGPAILPPFGPPPTDKPATYEVGVRNNCAFPIWIHGAGNGGTLTPDNQKLDTGAHAWYDAPKAWGAARVTAYGDGPQKGELDKVEMTFDASLNYNVTYVDWVQLPVEVIGVGTGADCKKVGCYVAQAAVLSGCPDGLLNGKRCNSAGRFCSDGANKSSAYCKKLDGEIARCAQTKAGCGPAAGSSTPSAYACNGGFFGDSAKWCAAVNRGMVDDPDNKDTTKYYKGTAFNTYSKWVHDVCPGIYAFPYDDYPPSAEESGFHSCTGPKYLEITFCPAG